MEENRNQNGRDRKENTQSTGSNDQRPRKQNSNSQYPRNRRPRSGAPNKSGPSGQQQSAQGTSAQSSAPRTQNKNVRQDTGNHTLPKSPEHTGRNQRSSSRQTPINKGDTEQVSGRRRNAPRNAPRDRDTPTGAVKEHRNRNQKEQGSRDDFQKQNPQRDTRNQNQRDNRRPPYGGRSERNIGNSRFPRKQIQVVETLEDVRQENERLEKEIWLEIADFHIMTLD